MISFFESLFRARSRKITAIFLSLLFFIYNSARTSSQPNFDGVVIVEPWKDPGISTSTPSPSPSAKLASTSQSCPPTIADNDFSPLTIRCRIQSAQAQAQSSLKSQSSTPKEAVTEYIRRYQRNPPKGFEKWVQFALDHGSKIIDDFDQIDRDLLPYRTPEAQQVFRELSAKKVDSPRTRRVTVENGTMTASIWYMYDDEWRRLLEPFVDALPDGTFFMSTIDEPRVLTSGQSHPDTVRFHDRPGQSIEDLITESCAQIPRNLTGRLGVAKDVCQATHPGELHALISSPSSFSYTYSLAPLLSFGRMSAFRDILIPCPCYLAHAFPDIQDPVPFLEKKPGVYWRGSSTGGKATRFNWQFGHRERFVSFIQSLQNTAKTLDAGQFFGANIDALDRKQIKLFKDVFDVHMGAYIQCDDEACKDMERTLGPVDIEPEDTATHYRYLFDLDGNSMSTRFYRLLAQNAVVLKQTWFHEWHDDRLVPWAHYIPVTMTMEELPAVISFLINDPAGESLSAEIAEAGSSWSREVLREIDMSIYVYRLLLEMADLYGQEDSDLVEQFDSE
ncbi:uncharacterized protein N7483_009273 [Penicillium malachiteum]|uniref:uncharacterized protein n=1 Tax=Penicillium malachiteum TaxID=1324776 RepID=UPI002549B8BC|nr:uncharacterized protein N7483_009273 [Penicillium malachiteum]KAJ5721339.1 hypothetical protein N7483_009273 [Penicillium malachiteum]